MRQVSLVLSLVLIFAGCSKKNAPEQAGMQSTPADSAVASKSGGTMAMENAPRPQPATSRQPEEPKATADEVLVRDDGRYEIQLSAWRTRGKALRVADALRASGLRVEIVEADIPEKGGRWYRIRLGTFRTMAEARSFLRSQLPDSLGTAAWIDVARK